MIVSSSYISRITGSATYLRWSVYYEGYIVKNEDGGNVMTYGLQLPPTSINDLASEMFATNDKQIELIKADWLSKLPISMLIFVLYHTSGRIF